MSLLTLLLYILLILVSTARCEISLVSIYKQSSSLNESLTLYCDGGLVHTEWVITSDQCNAEKSSPGLFHVMVKTSDRIYRRMVRSWNSKYYDKEIDFASIALLHLEYPFQVENNIIPVAIPREQTISKLYQNRVYTQCKYKSNGKL